jgi:hypothetical protein
MMWRKFIAIIAVAIAAVFATFLILRQTKPDVQSITLRHMSGVEAADLINDHFGPSVAEGWTDHVVFVRASKRRQEEIASLLAGSDKPRPQVALKFQLIEANGFTAQDTSIARVENVLRSLFRFRGYRLVSEAFVQAKEESTTKQSLVGSNEVRYQLNVTVNEVRQREGKASVEVTTELSGSDGSILETTVHVPTDQTVVLGTTQGARGALILVVTPSIK